MVDQSRTCDADEPDELTAHDDPVGVVVELLLLLEGLGAVVLVLRHVRPLEDDFEAARLEKDVEADAARDGSHRVGAVARLASVKEVGELAN